MTEAIECKRELIVDKSPATLENDLQDVAYAVGAIDRRIFVNPPAAYFRLVGVREIDGKPAGEVLDLSQSLFKEPS